MLRQYESSYEIQAHRVHFLGDLRSVVALPFLLTPTRRILGDATKSVKHLQHSVKDELLDLRLDSKSIAQKKGKMAFGVIVSFQEVDDDELF